MRTPSQGDGPSEEEDPASRHWRRSLKLALALLAVWFAASFGCGILLRDVLDQFTLPGTRFPLGFWFAQQGAIVIFVALIAAYVILASRIDRSLERERDAASSSRGKGPTNGGER